MVLMDIREALAQIWSRSDLKLAGLTFLTNKPASISVTIKLSGDGIGVPFFFFFNV